MEYTGATFSIASLLRFSVSPSSIIDINLGAENVAGEVSPTSILMIWFSGNNEKEINHTAVENNNIYNIFLKCVRYIFIIYLEILLIFLKQSYS